MKKLSSQIKISSAEFIEKKNKYHSLLETFKEYQSQARTPETESARTRLGKEGKFPVSERISRLIDPDSSVLEIGLLAGLDCYDGVPPGAGVYAVVAKVSGKHCMIIANIPSVKGGAYLPLAVKKHIRALEIALENRMPLIYLVDSGGAFLPLQSEIFPDRFHFGRIFYLQAQISARRIPQIACVLGSCTAGGAYIPAMSEQVIMVRGNSTIFLGGPPLVKAATGEVVTSEELGGADVHSRISGVSDYLEDTEEDALLRTRSLVACFQHSDSAGLGLFTRKAMMPTQKSSTPFYDPHEICGILDLDIRKPLQIKEIIARIVDESRFEEFKEYYGETVVCGFAYIGGYLSGIVANNGILFSESALKATHFITLCEQRRIPLLFLQNIAGFMVGKEYEQGGIAKDGAKMVTAVSSVTVPKYTLIVGGSFGAGNYGMCGRAYDPKFLFTWPHSKISVMGGSQAAHVLAEIKRAGKSASEKEIKKLKEETEARYEKEGNAFYATSQLWDDGIIDPAETRSILSLAFATTHFDPAEETRFGLFRM
jgi:acetyl-CoA carboxylase carboxyltransferase component